jgi:hypothetical protein
VRDPAASSIALEASLRNETLLLLWVGNVELLDGLLDSRFRVGGFYHADKRGWGMP